MAETVIYDGNLRERPTKGGTADPNTGKNTQYWDDGYRYTRDPQKGDHWTNDNKSKGQSGRHEGPPDRKK